MRKLPMNSISLIVFDFDGVFTNNKVIVSEEGKEYVICSRADGLGLKKLDEFGIQKLILSTETNDVVKKRSEKLKIECIHGARNKEDVLLKIIEKRKIPAEQVAFVGNDINDMACMKMVGWPVCVADAYPEIKKISKIVLSKNGGEGAVREFCDIIINARTHQP
jgi:3-deoxy-D-manno-octulosonate 8-phosphate phosphatase (KDO 8-P phosphatase)